MRARRVRASADFDGPMSLFDRFALFVGCGLIGAVLGIAAWGSLVLFSRFGFASNLSAQALLAWLAWSPLVLGGGFAIAGAFWPARTADALGTAWGWIFRIIGDPRL
ncbi:MAG: hypothetical protein ACREO3_01385 [Arenimonas sp.]